MFSRSKFTSKQTIIGLMLAFGLTSFSLGGEGVTLAYKFQPNQSLHYDYSQRMSMDVKKGGVKQHLETETIAHKHLRVISVDENGHALVEPVLDRTHMKENIDGRVVEFDSTEGEENCPNPVYRRILATLGKPMVRVKFASTGKVLEATAINGGDKAAQGLQDDATLNFLVVFPERSLQVGETWTDDFEVLAKVDRTLNQPVKLRREYRLTKLEGSEAVIEMKIGAITPINNPAIELQIASRLVSGTILFDHVAGRIVRREINVDRQVLGPLGQGSLVRTTMTQTETASAPTTPIARREEAARD